MAGASGGGPQRGLHVALQLGRRLRDPRPAKPGASTTRKGLGSLTRLRLMPRIDGSPERDDQQLGQMAADSDQRLDRLRQGTNVATPAGASGSGVTASPKAADSALDRPPSQPRRWIRLFAPPVPSHRAPSVRARTRAARAPGRRWTPTCSPPRPPYPPASLSAAAPTAPPST